MAAVGQKLDNRQFEVRSSVTNKYSTNNSNPDRDRRNRCHSSSPSLRPHLHQSQQVPPPVHRRHPLHLRHPLPHRRHGDNMLSLTVQPNRDRYQRWIDSSATRLDARPRPRL